MEEKEMDFGYQLPEEGNYIIEFDEGIDTYTNENSGKTSLVVPIKLAEVIPGDNAGAEESCGKTLRHFCPIETQFGEKQICMIISNVGLGQKFAEKFTDDDMSFLDTQFLTALKLALPGKLMCAEIENKTNVSKKDGKEYTNTNIVRWWKNEKKKASVQDEEDVKW